MSGAPTPPLSALTRDYLRRLAPHVDQSNYERAYADIERQLCETIIEWTRLDATRCTFTISPFQPGMANFDVDLARDQLMARIAAIPLRVYVPNPTTAPYHLVIDWSAPSSSNDSNSAASSSPTAATTVVASDVNLFDPRHLA